MAMQRRLAAADSNLRQVLDLVGAHSSIGVNSEALSLVCALIRR